MNKTTCIAKTKDVIVKAKAAIAMAEEVIATPRNQAALSREFTSDATGNRYLVEDFGDGAVVVRGIPGGSGPAHEQITSTELELIKTKAREASLAGKFSREQGARRSSGVTVEMVRKEINQLRTSKLNPTLVLVAEAFGMTADGLSRRLRSLGTSWKAVLK